MLNGRFKGTPASTSSKQRTDRYISNLAKSKPVKQVGYSKI